MCFVKSVHSLPAIRQIWIVISPNKIYRRCSSPRLLQHCKTEREILEHILPMQSHRMPSKDQPWRLRLIHESDFEKIRRSRKRSGQGSSNLSSHMLEDTELLTTNLLKTLSCLENPLSLLSKKIISKVPDEDVIEVFI